MPERDVLEPDERSRPHDAREPADPLGDDRIPLVRHRRGALLALAERLLHLGHLGPRQVTDLDREPLERGRGQGERGEQLGVTVALDDLRRGRLGLEAEPLAGDALDLGVDRRVVPDRAGELPDPHALERKRDARSRARSSSKAQTASLRPNVVGSAWTPCVRPIVSVSRCSSARATTASKRAVEPGQDQLAGGRDLERERRVDDVRRGEAVVEPAPFRAELVGDRVDEGGEVVVRLLLDLGDALRRRRVCLGANLARPPRRARRPTSAQPSSAASSTSSQRSSLPSSDQILAMAGRE